MTEKQRNLGIGVAVSGLLLLCCLCPLAINSWLFILTSFGNPRDRISLYGQLFTTSIGNLPLANYVSAVQFLCSSILALIVLGLGIAAITRARRAS